ncbi:hypothetical protein LCGC14_2634450, partial [marine sediment metagenome]
LLKFLPPRTDGPFYFRYYTHRLRGASWVVCPKLSFKEKAPCPMCALGDRLFRNQNDPDDVAKGKSLYRRETFIANIINVRKPDEGVKVLRFGINLKKALLEFFSDEDEEGEEGGGVDITDPKNGSYVRIKSERNKGGWIDHMASTRKDGNAGMPYAKWAKDLIDLEALVKSTLMKSDDLKELLAEMAIDEADASEEKKGEEEEEEEEEELFPEPIKKLCSKHNLPARYSDYNKRWKCKKC